MLMKGKGLPCYNNINRVDVFDVIANHCTDPSAATWALQSARLNTARYEHASIAFEGKIWFAGGWEGEDLVKSVEVYDPAAGECERAPNMTKERSHINLKTVADELFAVGGDTYGNFTIEKLSKVSGVWDYYHTRSRICWLSWRTRFNLELLRHNHQAVGLCQHAC
jgi:hypothetical protein